MTRCQFDLYDKFHNGFDDTEECDKLGIRNYVFGDMKVVSLCEEHYRTVKKQMEREIKK